MPTNTDCKLRVFLCHSSQDKPIVRELYQRLTAEGWIDPWLDEEKLRPGHYWSEKIEEAIEFSDVVIVFLSNNSVTKEGVVQKEIKRALDKAEEKLEDTIFIIPLRLEDCSVPRRLRSYQWQDYFDNPNLAYERLSSSLEERAKALEIDVFKTKQQYINQLIRKEFEEKLKIEQQEQTRKRIEEELRIQEEARQHKDAEELLRKRDMGSFIEIIQVVIAFMTLSPGFVLMIISMLIVYENYGSMVAAGFSETMGWWFFGLPLLLGLIPIGGPMIYENHWPVLITEKLQEVQLDPNAIWNTPSWVPWLPRQFFLAKTLYWTGNTIVWGFNIFIFTIIIAVLIVVLVGKVRNKQSISN